MKAAQLNIHVKRVKNIAINIFGLVIISIVFYQINFVIKGLHYSFDITDECLHVMWASHPEELINSFRGTPFILNKILNLSGGNLLTYRILGLLMIILSSVYLTSSFLKYMSRQMESQFGILDHVVTHSILLSSGLLYYKKWMTTPSYYLTTTVFSLIFISIFIKILDTGFAQRKKYFIFWGLITSIIVFNRWPTGLCTLCICLTYILLFEENKKVSTVSFTFGSILGIIFYSTLFQNVVEWYKLNQEAFHVLSLQVKDHYTILEMLFKFLTEIFVLMGTTFGFFKKCFITAIIIGIFIRFTNKSHTYLYIIPYMLAIYIVCSFGFSFISPTIRASETIIIFSYVIIALIYIITSISDFRYSYNKITIFPFILFLIPFTVIIGSKGWMVLLSNLHTIITPFILLLIFLLYNVEYFKKNKLYLYLIKFSIVLLFCTNLVISAENPRRQDRTLFELNEYVGFDDQNNQIMVSPLLASDINLFQKKLYFTNYQFGDDIIPLFRASHFVYFSQGKVPANPYMYDNYPGTLDYITYYLSKVSNERILKSWIILKRPVDSSIYSPDPKIIFKRLGINFDNNFIHHFSMDCKFDNSKLEFWGPN